MIINFIKKEDFRSELPKINILDTNLFNLTNPLFGYQFHMELIQ